MRQSRHELPKAVPLRKWSPLHGLLILAAVACSPHAITLEEYYQGLDDLATNAWICVGEAPEYAHSIAKGYGDDAVSAVLRARYHVTAGMVAFDGVKASQCIDALRLDPTRCWGQGASGRIALGPPPSSPAELAIGMLPSLLGMAPYFFGIGPAACSHVFSGKIPDGGACDTAASCKGGFCDLYNLACPGVCGTLLGKGADCKHTYCRPELSCNPNPAPADPTCEARRGIGDPCFYYIPGCEYGLYCDPATGRCVAPKAAGAPCVAFYECQSLICSASGICVQPASAGAPCKSISAQGPSVFCLGNQICAGFEPSTGSPGTCTVPHDVGGSCKAYGDKLDGLPTGCYEDLICDGRTLKCKLPPKAGEHCYCLLGQPGVPCPIRDACDLLSAYCLDGICQPQLDDGQPCTDGSQCHFESHCDPVKGCQPIHPGLGLTACFR